LDQSSSLALLALCLLLPFDHSARHPAGPMDGETEGYWGAHLGEVSPSVPSMPIAILSSVHSQFAIDAREEQAAPGLTLGATRALAAHKEEVRTGG
jgi:hypothetical protein